MSPATLGYPLKDIKLLLVNDREKNCSYWMYPLINRGSIRLVDMVRKFDPDAPIPGTLYSQVYKHCKGLVRCGYVTLERRECIKTEETFDLQEKQQETSVRDIFAAAVRKDTPPIVSSGTLPTEPDSGISTVKVKDSAFTVVPTEQLFALISRVQNSNQFLRGAKGRREMQDVREKAGINFAKLKLQKRRHCPYYVSARTKRDRMDAIFRLRGIRKHSMFKRRDKSKVNEELTRQLDSVQSSFENWIDDIDGKQITLQHKETGALKFIPYQTRFTDETRQDGIIARYHRVWKKAGEGFNTGVLLTFTSYPPSEIPKHFHRKSLLHVDRHFGVSQNAFMSKQTKRNRAIRRDELLDLKRMEVERTRPVSLKKERCWHCSGTGTVPGVTRATKIRMCPRCRGKGHLMKIALTKEERTAALLPMSKKYLIDQKLAEIIKTEPDRIELTEEETAAAIAPASFRPQYLSVYEFQKNGLLHSHVAIFGRSYLAYWEDIAMDWMKTGQGERIHVYGIQKEGEGWVWLKEQPKDARNRQPVDYLGKYLGKGVKIRGGHGMYFTINKRFFTNSRALDDDRELPDCTEKITSYEYIGTTRNDEIPAWLRNLHKDRKKAWAGGLDPLGWGAGDPGGGALA